MVLPVFSLKGSAWMHKTLNDKQILIACERSGVIRRAFRVLGYNAWSCDLEPSDDASPWHIIGDALEKAYEFPWRIMIAHPPCTHLAVAGARWFKDKELEQEKAIEFVRNLMNSPIPRICIENPVSIISSRIRKPDQIIQPWQFGDSVQKRTCLWLKNLPLLTSTKIVDKGEFVTMPNGKRMPKWYNLPQSKARAKIRSETFPGIAQAMAMQWSKLVNDPMLA